MKSQTSQIIPFPLPPYLASYFSNKITTETIICNDGSRAKPFNVKRNSAFGTFILRCLDKKEKVNIVNNQITFFIKVDDYKTSKDSKIVNSKYSFVGLSDEAITDIVKVFKSIFLESLKSYVAGAVEVTNLYVDRKRGIQKQAIINFCKKNNVIYTNQNLASWKKALYRDSKRVNINKTSVL